MPGFTVSITEDQVTEAIRTVLLALVPDSIEIVVAQDNRVPEPTSPNYIVMTPTYRARLATNHSSWDQSPDASPTVISFMQPTRVDMQLDVHGTGSSDIAQIISTVMRTDYAIQKFAAAVPGIGANIAPLYCDDGHQVPFISGEAQYEDRWVMELALQINPTVSTPQEFADSVEVGLIEVDARYPPGG